MARQTYNQARNQSDNQRLTALASALISGTNPDGTSFSQLMEQRGDNTQVFDGSVAFANSAAAGTVQNANIDPLPTVLQKDARYLVVVTNPSAESAITVRLRNRETFGATQRFPEITNFGVPVSTPEGVARVVEGFMLGEAARIAVSNDTAVGVAGAFTVQLRVRKL